jgi:hypothetical protein
MMIGLCVYLSEWMTRRRTQSKERPQVCYITGPQTYFLYVLPGLDSPSTESDICNCPTKCRAAYCSSNNASALDLCIKVRANSKTSQRPIECVALAIRSILDLTSPTRLRLSRERTHRAWNAFGKLAMNLNSPIATKPF